MFDTSSKRQTGRSTRLLLEALKQAKAGKYVIVVTDNEHHRRDLCLQFAEMSSGEIAGDTPKVHVPDGGSVTFETPLTVRMDWEKMTTLGAHKSCVTLVDHYAIEARFSAMWEMWQRFDA